jgi:type II secretion system protein D
MLSPDSNFPPPAVTRTLLAFGLLATILVLAFWPAPALAQNNRPEAQEPRSQGGAADIQPADEPANPPAGDAADGDQPVKPNGPPTTGPVRNRLPKEGKVVLAFNDVSVEETIPFIVEATGKVVMPINLAQLKNKKITLINDEPVDRAAALDLLVTSLRLNGIGVIETEDIVIIDLLDQMGNGKHPPVLTARDDVMGLKNRGQFIIKIYRLKKATAENVGERLQANLPDYAKIEIDPNSNQIMLFGDVGLAQSMQLLVNELDHNFIQVETQTFRLAYADAQAVADQIWDLFEIGEGAGQAQVRQAQQRGGAPQQRQGRNQPAAAGAASAAGPASPGPTVELRVSVNIHMNSVTVSAEPEKIARIAELIHEQWDLPRADETAKVYVLHHTDPLKVQELLSNLLGQGGGARRGGGGQTTRGGAQLAGGGGGGASSVAEAIGDIYRIEAYPDQNSVVVLSKTKDALAYLDYIIESIDQPSSVGLPQVVELKHANAVELATELNVLLAEAGTGGSLDAPERGLTGEGIGGISDESSTGGSEATGGGRSSGGTGGGTIEFPWQRGRPRDDQSEPSSLIGKVRIVPVVRQNALAILAPVAQRAAVVQLIRDFDRPGRQVMISAVIAEVELTDELALGLRFSSDELVSSVSDNSIRSGLSFDGSNEGVFGSLFDTSVLDVSADLNVLIQALRQKTNVRILQEPRVFTADNQEAIFFDGQDVPFITDSQTTDIGGLTQSFEYKQVGVQIDVRPRITAERDVDMEVNLELSSIVPGETLFGAFILDRRETTTKVIVKNGQTIVLSGILTDSESQITRGIPLLEDIPIFGELFRSRENSHTTTELIAFITPIVVDNPSENDENFNETARERLKDLAQPLREQQKHRSDIREQILGPKGKEQFRPVFPTGDIVQPPNEPSGGADEDKPKEQPGPDQREESPLVDLDDLIEESEPE